MVVLGEQDEGWQCLKGLLLEAIQKRGSDRFWSWASRPRLLQANEATHQSTVVAQWAVWDKKCVGVSMLVAASPKFFSLQALFFGSSAPLPLTLPAITAIVLAFPSPKVLKPRTRASFTSFQAVK